MCVCVCVCMYANAHFLSHAHKPTRKAKSETYAKVAQVLEFKLACQILHLRDTSRSPLHKRQRTATHCNTLQHTATHCNTLQHTTPFGTQTFDSHTLTLSLSLSLSLFCARALSLSLCLSLSHSHKLLSPNSLLAFACARAHPLPHTYTQCNTYDTPNARTTRHTTRTQHIISCTHTHIHNTHNTHIHTATHSNTQQHIAT